jgi:hypothetical protein
MFKPALQSHSFSTSFRTLMSADPTLTNRKLAALFYEEFPQVDSIAVQHIWHWKSPAKPSGHIDDERIDALLLQVLSDAGYLKG